MTEALLLNFAGAQALGKVGRFRVSQKRDARPSVATFLEEIKLTKKPKTFAAYSKTLAYFE